MRSCWVAGTILSVTLWKLVHAAGGWACSLGPHVWSWLIQTSLCWQAQMLSPWGAQLVSPPPLSHLECSPSIVGSWLASQVTGSPGPQWQKKVPTPVPRDTPCSHMGDGPPPLWSKACLDHGGHALSQTICVHYLVLCRELLQTQRLDTISIFHTVSVGQEFGLWSWMVLPGRELWLGCSRCVGRACLLHSPWGWRAGAGCWPEASIFLPRGQMANVLCCPSAQMSSQHDSWLPQSPGLWSHTLSSLWCPVVTLVSPLPCGCTRSQGPRESWSLAFPPSQVSLPVGNIHPVFPSWA